MSELDFSKYSTAVIIGNGFDINLDLPTGYDKFIVNPQFERLINNGNQLAIHLNNSYALKNWIDIEKELALYSIDGATETYKKARLYTLVYQGFRIILVCSIFNRMVNP